MIYTIYVSEFSSNQIWDMLKLTRCTRWTTATGSSPGL